MKRVRVGETLLKRRDIGDVLEEISPPSADAFNHYCIDENTAGVLHHVATCVHHREPCLLEGETATSKTSIILFLAQLLNQPVKRINLNGQTDTGEIIGRYVPDDDDAAQPGKWRWQHGDIVNAMNHGWWVILDEVNLAEPQILERLNPLLEKHPSLTLSEYDNSEYSVFASEKDKRNPIHPDFRIFATMNPAEYAGRTALSPAYKDRWTGYRFVKPPEERDYLAMLNLWVHGTTPNVHVLGHDYTGTELQPWLTSLGALQGVDIDQFLTAIARLHYSVVKASSSTGSTGLGRGRRERPVFTRRLLMALMEYIDGSIDPGDEPERIIRVIRLGLRRYYLSRVTAESDRETVCNLLDGLGIGPNVWTLWTE